MTDLEAVEAIESGAASQETIVEAVQQLIDTGTVWHLQGSYGRLAYRMIESGDCSMVGRGS